MEYVCPEVTNRIRAGQERRNNNEGRVCSTAALSGSQNEGPRLCRGIVTPTLVAVVIEIYLPTPFMDPSIRKSAVVLRQQYFASGVGLFEFQILGRSDLADTPGFDAAVITDPATFFAFAQSVGSLRFDVIGYRLTIPGGFDRYGNLHGDLTFEPVGAVPLPASVWPLAATLATLMSRRRSATAT